MLEEQNENGLSLEGPEPEPDIRDIAFRLNQMELKVAALTESKGTDPFGDKPTPESPLATAREDQQESKTESTVPSVSPSIKAWFRERGFTATLAKDEAGSRVYLRLAEYLGDHIADLERFLRGLKWTAHEGKKSSLGFRDATDAERRHTLEFAKMLHDLALLGYHNYNERADRLTFMSSERTEFLRFIRGAWLEQYVLATVERIVEANGGRFEISRGVQVKHTESNLRFEMDVFALLEETPLWIECKSGDYRAHIEKYVERAGEIGIPLDHTFLVVSGVADDVAHDLTEIFGLSVTPAATLAAEITAVIGAAQDPLDLDLETRLERLFADSQMSPFPAVRREVLEALTNTADALPATVAEIRDRVREDIAEDKQKAVHPILLAVRRSGGLLDETGTALGGLRLDLTVHALAGTDPATLEAICQSSYEKVIERKMPEAREEAGFEEVFRRFVG
jgi:hypothetical protein